MPPSPNRTATATAKRHTVVVETTATFRIWGDADRRADAVTSRLSITPLRCLEVGDPVSPSSPAPRKDSAWLLESSEGIEEGVELGDQLVRLLDVLEPVAADLWDLIRDGYRANWFCYVASNPAEHAAELNRDLLARLLLLPGDLWLDVCGDGALNGAATARCSSASLPGAAEWSP